MNSNLDKVDNLILNIMGHLSFSVCLVQIGTFATTITFPVLGDWGGKEGAPYNTHAQVMVANIMNEQCRTRDCDFMISIGYVHPYLT